MVFLLKNILHFMPLIFGIGFIGPVSTALIQSTGWSPPWGLSPILCGFVLGGTWGLYAQWRGSWIAWNVR